MHVHLATMFAAHTTASRSRRRHHVGADAHTTGGDTLERVCRAHRHLVELGAAAQDEQQVLGVHALVHVVHEEVEGLVAEVVEGADAARKCRGHAPIFR